MVENHHYCQIQKTSHDRKLVQRFLYSLIFTDRISGGITSQARCNTFVVNVHEKGTKVFSVRKLQKFKFISIIIYIFFF